MQAEVAPTPIIASIVSAEGRVLGEGPATVDRQDGVMTVTVLPIEKAWGRCWGVRFVWHGLPVGVMLSVPMDVTPATTLTFTHAYERLAEAKPDRRGRWWDALWVVIAVTVAVPAGLLLAHWLQAVA